MYNVDVDCKHEENRDIFDGNLFRLLNKRNQIKVLHFQKVAETHQIHIYIILNIWLKFA